jgi:ketosteroid isomerase-like protein
MATFGEQIRDILERVDELHPEVIDELMAFYSPNVVFEDPTQKLVGAAAFERMNKKALAKANIFMMTVHDLAETDTTLFATWTLRYEPKVGPPLSFEGVTHARIEDGLIVEHRDYWDLLSSVMNAFPMAGMAYRTLVAKLV